jgi:phage terminase large subunit-like protein
MSVASDIATALDPTRLLRAAGLDPDPWQRDLLLSPWRRALLLCSRQSGKSTVTAALGLHTALYQPGSTTLLTAPSMRQSKELFAKVWGFYRDMGKPVRVERKSALRAQFVNGSRVIALPGKERNLRGFTADAIVIDEAARVEDSLYHAIRPMLAVSGGRLVALTTPWGKRGWFYEAWTDDSQDWHRVKVTADDVPRITESFLEQERRELGSWLFRQEYFVEFTDTEDQFFRTDDIERAAGHDFAPLFQDAPHGPRLLEPRTFEPLDLEDAA